MPASTIIGDHTKLTDITPEEASRLNSLVANIYEDYPNDLTNTTWVFNETLCESLNTTQNINFTSRCDESGADRLAVQLCGFGNVT